MGEGLDLVFQYFFTVGAGVGMGLMISVLPAVLVYRVISKKLNKRR